MCCFKIVKLVIGMQPTTIIKTALLTRSSKLYERASHEKLKEAPSINESHKNQNVNITERKSEINLLC